MPRYEYKTGALEHERLTDDRPTHASYTLLNGQTWVTHWGGVLDKWFASSLRPWALPVQIRIKAYRVNGGDWINLPQGAFTWGCLLQGVDASHAVVFGLVNDGAPLIYDPTIERPARCPRQIDLPAESETWKYVAVGWSVVNGPGRPHLRWAGIGPPFLPPGITAA